MLFPTLETPSSDIAVRFGDVVLTYDELARRARAHAAGLLERRIALGDRVLVFAKPSIGTIVALVGNALASVVSVPVDPELDDNSIARLVADTTPRLAVGASRAVADLPVTAGPLEGDPAKAPAISPHDERLLILFTSGTTGAPKGVVHKESSIAFTLDALAEAWKLTRDDALVHALPLFHAHGLVFGLFGALRVGASLRVLPRFDAAEVACRMHDEASVLYASPAQLQALGELAERDAAIASAVRRARLVVTGSAPFPVRESLRLARVTGHRAVERYGVTEAFINASMRVDDERRPGTVGRALVGVSVRLVDDARAPTIAHDGESIGEIAVRGPNVFEGYWNRPEATAAVRDEAGWFYTGDLGTIAIDGTVRVVGRRSTDLIRTSEGRVAAGEVEWALLEHPAVREAAVVSIASSQQQNQAQNQDDRIVAFVALRDGAVATVASIGAHVAESLPRHKRPGSIALVTALPRNAIGKVIKSELRARAVAMEGAS